MSYISLYNEPLFSEHLYQADADPRIDCILAYTESTIVVLDLIRP